MLDDKKWDLYWNLDNGYQCRANLVYSAYVSKDRQHFCQWFGRDTRYHTDPDENAAWTEDLLEDRFSKELKFYNRARTTLPVLELVDVDSSDRTMIFRWPGDDFLMQSIHAGSMSAVLPDWQEQWISRVEEMWSLNITKLSLHPNSWTVRDGVLVPFNWFFCYDTDEDTDSFENFSIQISSGRMEGLWSVFDEVGITFSETYPVKQLQKAAFISFKKNYPEELMDTMLGKLQ
jgi:hypothetical protein